MIHPHLAVAGPSGARCVRPRPRASPPAVAPGYRQHRVYAHILQIIRETCRW